LPEGRYFIFSAKDFLDTFILAGNVDNNGSRIVNAPSSVTDSGRFMIKAANNIF
jgi:hypothetical protein